MANATPQEQAETRGAFGLVFSILFGIPMLFAGLLGVAWAILSLPSLGVAGLLLIGVAGGVAIGGAVAVGKGWRDYSEVYL